MKSRIVVASLLLFGVLGVGTFASHGTNVVGSRSWALVNFVNPVTVQDRMIMGPVMIVHDNEKMARGEACTTFYRFDPARGPREELASFHCQPVERTVAESTTFTLVSGPDTTCPRLVEYQIAGESEGHRVPAR